MELFQLLGTIAINNDAANREIDETTEKAEQSSSKIGSAFKKIGSLTIKAFTAATTAAATGIAAITKAAVSGFGDYEQLVGGVETLFKQSSGTVIKYADNAYKTAGMSANQYMETVTSFSASLLQGLGGDTAKAAKVADLAITDMADNANKMGSNMEDIQNAYQGFAKQNYTMLDNLKLGYGGTQAEMVRLINDSGILNEKIDDLENVTFDQMIMAIHKVQDNLGITGTTALEAATTIQGSIASAKGAWENFLVGLAAGDQDMKQLTQNLGNSIVTVADNVIPRIQTTLDSIGTLIETVVPPLIRKLPEMLGGILPSLLSSAVSLVTSIVTTLGSTLQSAMPQMVQAGVELLTKLGEGMTTGVPQLLDKATTFLLDFSGSLREGAGQLIDAGLNMILKLGEGLANALPTLIERVPTIVSNIAGIINDNAPKLITTGVQLIVTLVKGLIQAIPTIIANIPKIIKAIVDVILAYNWLQLGKKVMDGFKNGIDKMKDSVKAAAVKIKDAVVNAIKALPAKLLSLGKSAVTNIKNALLNSGSVRSAAANLASGVVSAIKTLPKKALEIGGNLVKGLWNGIGNAKDWIISKVKGFGDSILSSLKSFFGIHSPSTVMEKEVGVNLAKGVIKGMEGQAANVYKMSKKNLGDTIGKGLVAGVMASSENAKKSASQVASAVVKAAKEKLNDYKTYHDVSLKDEMLYWDNIRKQCKKGTKARIEADKQYVAAKKKLTEQAAELDNELVEKAEKRLDKYKTYNDMSLAAEMEYWDKIRKQCTKGTDARLAADKKYFEAKESLNEQLIALEQEYQTAIDTASQKIVDRTNQILQAFSLFDTFEIKVDEENPVTGGTLIESLESQVNALDDWSKEINTLKQKMGDTELFQAIQEMGVSSLQQVKAINAMTEEQLQQYVDLYNKRQELAKEQATTELGAEVMADMQAAYKTYKESVEALGVTVKKQYKNIDTYITTAMKNSDSITSSKMDSMVSTMKTGVVNIGKAVESKFSEVANTIASKMSAAVASVKEAVAEAEQAAASASVPAADSTSTSSTGSTSSSGSSGKIDWSTVSSIGLPAHSRVRANAAGGILTKPTIFGYTPSTGEYQMGGEAGEEAIAPIDTLQGYVAAAVASQNAELVTILKTILKVLKSLNLSVELDGKEIANNVNKRLGVVY